MFVQVKHYSYIATIVSLRGDYLQKVRVENRTEGIVHDRVCALHHDRVVF